MGGESRALTLGVAALLAAALAAGVLILVVATGPAEAAFPGTSGDIVFATNRDGST